MKKAAIQLSVNFLVILIMCLVILGVGVTLFNKYWSNTGKWITKVDSLTQRQLDSMLVEGKRLAIAQTAKDVERGTWSTFFLAIKNSGENAWFSVETDYGTTSVSNPPINNDINSWIINPDTQYYVEKGETIYKTIGIRPKAGNPARGQYVFNVDVCHGIDKESAKCDPPNVYGVIANRYPPPLQIIVNVK